MLSEMLLMLKSLKQILLRENAILYTKNIRRKAAKLGIYAYASATL
jgi:hypothetical protein